MGDEHPVQALETQAGLQDLTLRAFATVDQEAEFIVDDDLARESTMNGRSGSGGTQEDDFEQASLVNNDRILKDARILPYFIDKCRLGEGRDHLCYNAKDEPDRQG